MGTPAMGTPAHAMGTPAHAMGTPVREACVVGGGIVGSWAALHLVEAGVRTTLFEQFPQPHARGSSHGRSRAFRFLGDEDLDRLEFSLRRWRELESTTGATLLVETGLLNFGPEGDPFLEKHMAIVRASGRPCEWLGHDVMAARYPMLRYPGEWGAAWDPHGGILLADRCLTGVRRRFRELGGRIVTARVDAIETRSDGGVELRIQAPAPAELGQSSFDRAVVCAGPWTGRLLPELGPLLRTVHTPVTYWADPTDSYSAASGLPILFNARLTDVYGLPSCEYPGLAKILFHGGPDADPDSPDPRALEPYIRKVGDYVREHLPLLEPERPALQESCFYTMSLDGAPIIDRLPDGLIVGAGFSGSGFKHSPATGYMLALLALGREAELPRGFARTRYALDRFAGRSP